MDMKKFKNILSDPENIATMLVLGTALSQGKQPGESNLSRIGKAAVGGMAFKGGMQSVQEARDTRRTNEQLQRQNVQSEIATRQTNAAATQTNAQANAQNANTNSREVALREKQLPHQTRNQDAQTGLMQSQAGYYDRMPQTLERQDLIVQAETRKERQKYWNDWALESLKSVNTQMSKAVEMGAKPTELAPYMAQISALQWFGSRGAMLEDATGVRPFMVFDKEGNVAMGHPNFTDDNGIPYAEDRFGQIVPLATLQGGTAVVPAPGPGNPQPTAAPITPPEEQLTPVAAQAKPTPQERERRRQEANREMSGVRGIENAMRPLQERKDAHFAVRRLRSGKPTDEDIKLLKTLPRDELKERFPALTEAELSKIYGG